MIFFNLKLVPRNATYFFFKRRGALCRFFFSSNSLILIIPELAVAFRQLHDIGKSGWNLLFSFLPVVGWIVLIVFYCKKDEDGVNKYGPSPLNEKPLAV